MYRRCTVDNVIRVAKIFYVKFNVVLNIS
jgi:hypothetical protein